MALKLNKAKARNLVQRTKFIHHLDRYIAKGDFPWTFDYEPKKGDTGWHPSSHCTPSPAELYHIALDGGVEEDFPASLYKTFMVGHFWHQYLQEITVKAGFAEPAAVERRGIKGWGHCIESGTKKHYQDWHYCTGSGDLAPVVVPIHGEFLVDFKTMGSHMFKPVIPPGETIEKWECQMNIYMDFFTLERALVVGINKDAPHDMKEFEFHRNEPLIDALYAKWELVSVCLEEGVEPPIDEEIYLPLEGPVDDT
jgi:hypothetical protein